MRGYCSKEGNYQGGCEGCDDYCGGEAALGIDPASEQVAAVAGEREHRGVCDHHGGSFQALGTGTHYQVDVGCGGEPAEQAVQDCDYDCAARSPREEHDRALEDCDDRSPPKHAR